MMNETVVYHTAATAGAVIFAYLIFKTLFRYMTPDTVSSNYKCCNGGWHEAKLAECHISLRSVPQQPINTWSNLAYLAAGLIIQFSVGTDPAFVFAVTMTYLCIGSTLYHATSTGWAGVLDVTAILTVFPSIAIYAAAGQFRAADHPLTPLVMFLAAGLIAYLLSKRANQYMRAVIALSLGTSYLLLLVYIFRTGQWPLMRYLLGSLALFVVGYVSWGLDKKAKFPITPWGHGVWHVATAAASALVFYAVHLSQQVAP
jgi:channel protein (hemolysin III family)